MISLKSPQEIDIMRDANRIVAEILAELEAQIAPGITTMELNELGERLATERDARPAFKGYNGFPYALCASVNEEVVHGIPSRERSLRQGDIVSLDFGVVHRDYYGDAAIKHAQGKTVGSSVFEYRYEKDKEPFFRADNPGTYLVTVTANQVDNKDVATTKAYITVTGEALGYGSGCGCATVGSKGSSLFGLLGFSVLLFVVVTRRLF